MTPQRTAYDRWIKWVGFSWTLLLVGLHDWAPVPVYGAPPESISQVDVTAARGELASTTFSIYTFKTYDRVRLDASGLSNG